MDTFSRERQISSPVVGVAVVAETVMERSEEALPLIS
tara:strand:- start:497 stop:607 length:111 start_codon:yes stop_codon:yes gene_type:complete